MRPFRVKSWLGGRFSQFRESILIQRCPAEIRHNPLRASQRRNYHSGYFSLLLTQPKSYYVQNPPENSDPNRIFSLSLPKVEIFHSDFGQISASLDTHDLFYQRFSKNLKFSKIIEKFMNELQTILSIEILNYHSKNI